MGCQCSTAIRVLGEGCRYCQPQEHIDKLSEWLKEERDRVGELEDLVAYVFERARNKLSPMFMALDAYKSSPFEDDYLNRMTDLGLQSGKELTRIIKQCEEG